MKKKRENPPRDGCAGEHTYSSNETILIVDMNLSLTVMNVSIPNLEKRILKLNVIKERKQKMKIELKKEEVYNNPYPWFKIEIDGVFITGSYDHESIKKKFDEIKANPDIIKTKENVLQSEEI